MTVHIEVTETTEGWTVQSSGEDVTVWTEGDAVTVTAKPDAEPPAKPLDVSLAG